jgi:hypothetical protein
VSDPDLKVLDAATESCRRLEAQVAQLTAERDRLQAREQETRDSIVLAANAARGWCVERIRRAVAETRRLGLLPLNADECATILENSSWDDVH